MKTCSTPTATRTEWWTSTTSSCSLAPIPPHDSWKSVSLSPTARRHRACHARPRQVPGDLPRSIQDILDHGDQLAELFENYEPEPGDERPVEEYVLHRAALARSS